MLTVWLIIIIMNECD